MEGGRLVGVEGCRLVGVEGGRLGSNNLSGQVT